MIEALSDRAQYPVLSEAVYLNQAALGLIGERSVQAMHRFLEDVARHGNYRMGDEAEADFLEALRSRGASLLNCDVDQLAILASASELLGQLPLIMRPDPGKTIVAVSTDFPAVTRPWIRYASEMGCTVEFVDDRADSSLTDALISQLSERTSVVAVGQVQYATGSVIDVPRLRAATSQMGASLVVDVTQSAGTLPINSVAWGADAVVTSGYKWLGGHGGVALGVLADKWLGNAPVLPGWMGSPDPFDFDATRLAYATGGRRFTQSTMSYTSIAGLTVALGGSEGILDRAVPHACALSRRLIAAARQSGWEPFRNMGDESASPHIVALAHRGMDAAAAALDLRRKGVVCGVRNGRIRVSLAPYTNSEDVDILAEELSKLELG